MNQIQLECFTKVADTLSFSKAAQELHLSQPSVSKQIYSLEKELNIRLFNRSTRNVELTAAGESFLMDARNILADMQHACQRIASYGTESSYSLRIGYTEVTELPYLSAVFEKMRTEYPNISPFLRMGSIQDHLTRLGQGGLDVVFGLQDVEWDKNNMDFRKLMETRLYAIMKKGHHLCNHETVNKEELVRYPQVLYVPVHRRNRNISDFSDKMFITSSVAETYALVYAGMGYAVIPSCYLTKDSSLRAIPVADSDIIPYGMYIHKGMIFPALKRFALFAVKEMEKHEAGC